MKTRPSQFIDDPIEVDFDSQPSMEKSPPCPQRFTWRGSVHTVNAVLEEWVDFQRRGKMSRNMSPTHLASAVRAGS